LGVQPVPLSELMRDSDAVCVLLQHFARFDGLFGERLLSLAKPHQVIASLAHSAIFDEEALAWALADGPVGAAWIDSLAPGALDPGRPLHQAHNLQATPCVAPTTRESRLRAAWVVAERIDAVLRMAQSARPLRLVARGGRAGPAGVPEPA
jgi:phosphoglycerate dehydrogenase-like enzyme